MTKLQEMAALHRFLRGELTGDPIMRMQIQHQWAHLPEGIGDYERNPYFALETAQECFPSVYEEALKLIPDGGLQEAADHIGSYAEGQGFMLAWSVEDPLGDFISVELNGFTVGDGGPFDEMVTRLMITYLEPEELEQDDIYNSAFESFRYDMLRIMTADLPPTMYDQVHPGWVEVAWAIHWLCNSTGNRICDSYDDADECCGPPMWSPPETAYHLAELEEAADLLGKIGRGLNLLENHPRVIQTLRAKLQTYRVNQTQIARSVNMPVNDNQLRMFDDPTFAATVTEEEINDGRNARLEWPGLDTEPADPVSDFEPI